MADRVRAVKETHGGRYSRPWVVYVDGRKLLDGRGGQRRFKTEDAARDAGVRTAARGVAPAAHGLRCVACHKPYKPLTTVAAGAVRHTHLCECGSATFEGTFGVAASDGETVAREAAAPSPPEPAGTPEGYKLVPIEPTPMMLAAVGPYSKDQLAADAIYRAMLAATPQAAAPADGDTAFLAARLRRLFEHFKCQLPQFADDDARLIGIAGSVIGTLLTRLEAAAWTNVKDAAPPCDGHTVFIGINSAGYACCFNAIWQGQCVMETAEGSYQQMSDLRQWCRLERPTP